jgi:PPP family 3-phenylpropionic acid transporter
VKLRCGVELAAPPYFFSMLVVSTSSDRERGVLKKIWPFSFNFILFASTAFVSPFIVLYFQRLGFNGVQIGILTGIAPLVTFVAAPLWSALADATRRHHLILAIAILLGIAMLIVYPLVSAFLPILFVAIFLNFFFAPVSAFADSATMHMLADKRELYGRVRVGGSIGFGLAATVAGTVVENFGLKYAFWGCAGLFFLNFFISQKLEYGQIEDREPISKKVRTLLANPRWVLFLVVAFAGGLSLAALNNYYFPYMSEMGYSESIMGRTLTIGSISEIPVMFFSNRLVKRFGSYKLLILAMIVTIVRLFLYAASDLLVVIVIAQLLNGFTFPIIWVAGVSYADENAPQGLRTTAQGLFGAMVFGIGMAVGGLVGGPLLENIGGRGLYLVFGLAILITILVAEFGQRRHSLKRLTA